MRRALDEEIGGADLFRRDDEEVARWMARKVVFMDLQILAHDTPQRPAPAASEGGEATPRQVEQAARAEQSASPAQSKSSSTTSSRGGVGGSALRHLKEPQPVLPCGGHWGWR